MVEISPVMRVQKYSSLNKSGLKNILGEFNRELGAYKNNVNINLTDRNIYKEYENIFNIIENSVGVDSRVKADVYACYVSIDTRQYDIIANDFDINKIENNARFLKDDKFWEKYYLERLSDVKEIMGEDYIVTNVAIHLDETFPHMQVMGIYREKESKEISKPLTDKEIMKTDKFKKDLENSINVAFSRHNSKQENPINSKTDKELYKKAREQFKLEYNSEAVKRAITKWKKNYEKEKALKEKDDLERDEKAKKYRYHSAINKANSNNYYREIPVLNYEKTIKSKMFKELQSQMEKVMRDKGKRELAVVPLKELRIKTNDLKKNKYGQKDLSSIKELQERELKRLKKIASKNDGTVSKEQLEILEQMLYIENSINLQRTMSSTEYDKNIERNNTYYRDVEKQENLLLKVQERASSKIKEATQEVKEVLENKDKEIEKQLNLKEEELKKTFENLENSYKFKESKIREEFISLENELQEKKKIVDKYTVKPNEKGTYSYNDYETLSKIEKNAKVKKSIFGKEEIVEISKKEFDGMFSMAKDWGTVVGNRNMEQGYKKANVELTKKVDKLNYELYEAQEKIKNFDRTIKYRDDKIEQLGGELYKSKNETAYYKSMVEDLKKEVTKWRSAYDTVIDNSKKVILDLVTHIYSKSNATDKEKKVVNDAHYNGGILANVESNLLSERKISNTTEVVNFVLENVGNFVTKKLSQVNRLIMRM